MHTSRSREVICFFNVNNAMLMLLMLRYSRVLHCAFLLRTNFASSAHAHERARVQNIRHFLQAKLDSEIKANFLLNEHGDPHVLFYKFNENNIRNN